MRKSCESKRAPRWRRVRKLKLRQYGGDVIDLGRNATITTGVLDGKNIHIDKPVSVETPVSDEDKAKAVSTEPEKVMLNGDKLNGVIDEQTN